ncbi:TetR/AcrR family transcriptional regulator [Enterococcus sp. CSURQ0835]|uniref:TetR/AcrR family transcriptional regulator n=1 Tax=Enterococcus sp. CSURQ0835 TaxID=2681394 RepID=UPI001359739B|nr:TetR/AcrR family transcriptional regulator [Enterococcus sp. CSURQ0835]
MVNPTKKSLVQALIQLSQAKPFDKITVQDITKQAQLNRQTFYYHFKDKTDLLRFAYYECGMAYLTSDKLSLDNWEEAALLMLKTMKDNHAFYLQTVTADPEVLSQEFTKLAKGLFVRLLDDVAQEITLTTADKEFYARFLAHGCAGILIDWLKNGTIEPPITIAAQLFQFAKDIEFFAYRLYQRNREH